MVNGWLTYQDPSVVVAYFKDKLQAIIESLEPYAYRMDIEPILDGLYEAQEALEEAQDLIAEEEPAVECIAKAVRFISLVRVLIEEEYFILEPYAYKLEALEEDIINFVEV